MANDTLTAIQTLRAIEDAQRQVAKALEALQATEASLDTAAQKAHEAILNSP